MAWPIGAIAIGLLAPWAFGRLVDGWDWLDMPNWYVVVWASTAVVTTAIGFACAWVVIRHSPVGDRLLGVLLAAMTLAITAAFVADSSPCTCLEIDTTEGTIPAPPGLDRGIIAPIGYLALGLPIVGGFLWRGFSPPGSDDSIHVSSVRRAVTLGAILVVTVGAAYWAWAVHTLTAMRAGFFSG